MNAGLVLTTAFAVAAFQGFGNAGVIALLVFSLVCGIAQGSKS